MQKSENELIDSLNNSNKKSIKINRINDEEKKSPNYEIGYDEGAPEGDMEDDFLIELDYDNDIQNSCMDISSQEPNPGFGDLNIIQTNEEFKYNPYVQEPSEEDINECKNLCKLSSKLNLKEEMNKPLPKKHPLWDYDVPKLSDKEREEIKSTLEATKNVIGSCADNWDKIKKIPYFNPITGLINSIPSITTEDKQKVKNYLNTVESLKKNSKLSPAIIDALLLDKYKDDNSNTLNSNEYISDNVTDLSDKEKLFKSITDDMFSTYQKKNKDYGSSFDQLFDEFGMTSAILRMQDKLNRLKAINKNNNQINVKDESVIDTLKDLANYAILTILKIS